MVHTHTLINSHSHTKYTHTHTHTYIYIYCVCVYIPVSMCHLEKRYASETTQRKILKILKIPEEAFDS